MEIGKDEVKGTLIFHLRETRKYLEQAGKMTRAFTPQEREEFSSFHRVVSGIENGLVRLHQRGLYRK